ncbi:MAG: hypothetical protein K1V84_07870 [Muribaculaceae bacterium]
MWDSSSLSDRGQNVNKGETTVRAIHSQTGLSVRCTEERSKSQNKSLARYF